MRTVLIGPRYQVAARAELQFLQGQSFHLYVDALHFEAALWTSAIPERGISGCGHGIAIVRRHGTNPLPAIRPDNL